MLKNLFSSKDIYVDLGTANTVAYLKGQGFVLNEPTIIAEEILPSRERKVIAIGHDSKEMLGRTPVNVEVTRPLKEGVIANFNAAEKMLVSFLTKIFKKDKSLNSHLIVSLPCLVTQHEKDAIREIGRSLGAKRVSLILEPVAAALGGGLDIFSPKANFIVDIGGGTSEVALISMGEIVEAHAVRVGGDEMDERIVQFIRNKYGFLIGEQTAELLKMELGTALPDAQPRERMVKGLELVRMLPVKKSIHSNDIHAAIEPVVVQILKAIKQTLEITPPELAGDLVENGIWLAGGGALLENLDRRIQNETGIKVQVVDKPLLSVAQGGAYALEHPQTLEKIILN